MNKFIYLMLMVCILLSCKPNNTKKEPVLNRYLDIRGNVKSFVEETCILGQDTAVAITKSVITNNRCIQDNLTFGSESKTIVTYSGDSLKREELYLNGQHEAILVFGQPDSESSFCIINDRGRIKKGYVKYNKSGYITEYHAEDNEGFFTYDDNNNLISVKAKRSGDQYAVSVYEYLTFDIKGNWTKRRHTIKSFINTNTIQSREYEYAK